MCRYGGQDEFAAVKKTRNKYADRQTWEKYKAVLGTKNVPRGLDKWQDLKYNGGERWEKLKEQYSYAKQPYLQSRLDYVMPNGEKGFIPNRTRISTVKTIAGAGTDKKLRIENSLVKNFGGKIGEWQKRVGKIESEKYAFDVHWYEHDGKQYKAKVKERSGRK